MATGVELASAWVRIIPTMEGLQGNLATALGPVEDEADKTGQQSGKRFSTGFKVGMTLLAGFVVKEVGGALLSTVNAASDLSEAGTAVGAIFGDSFGSINDWAKKAGTNIGQSQIEALNAAKSFGVFGQAAGLTNEENAKFSTGLASLASDFASFHNVSPQEAIEAIGAGLRGEAEPLRKFGILMDDASLKAKAMEMGIYDGNGTLDAQAKILAANALIFDQAGAAQGDFARTSDGMANQQRILDASFQNLQATIGTALMPVMQGLLSVAQPITTWLTENPVLVQTLAIIIGILSAAILVAAAAMWVMNSALLASPVTWVIVGIVALVAAIVALAMNWDQVVSFVTTIWQGFLSWMGSVLDGFVNFWKSVWSTIVAFVTNTWNGFIGWITGNINGFVSFWSTVWNNAGNLIRAIWSAFTAAVQQVWNAYISWVMGNINGFVGWWNGIWAAVGAFLSAAWSNASSAAQSILSGMLSFLTGAVNGFFGWWNGIWGTVGNVIRSAFGGVASFIGGVWDGIVSKIRGAVNSIISTINGMIGALNGLLSGIGNLTGMSLSLPKIPGLYRGGTITSPGSVLVGERGPEILNLPRGASVDPDIRNTGTTGGTTFNNYAPVGQSFAQALSQFANRAAALQP